MSWRFIATRLNGDGSESMLDNDLPLSGVSLTETLSGADGLSGKISPEIARLVGEDGLPVILPWSTAIYAEVDGLIRGGAIVEGLGTSGPELSVDCVGFTGYLKNLPYTDELSKLDPDPLGIKSGIQIDPLDVARHIWAHVQASRDGNLGMVLDSTKSPIKIGTKETDVEFTTGAGEDVAFEAGPYVLAWFQTDDLGKEFDDLAANTPFDYRVEHAWDGDTISHKLRLGYPHLGRRRNDLRFVIGENVSLVPAVDFGGDEYADEVLVLGAGEGRKMVRGTAVRPSGRLRRVAVVPDKSKRSKATATKAAESEVAHRLGAADVTEIAVRNHPHAPVGSWDVGDEILLQGNAGWAGDLNMWVRIIESTISPNESDTATLTVVRSDKAV